MVRRQILGLAVAANYVCFKTMCTLDTRWRQTRIEADLTSPLYYVPSVVWLHCQS